MRVIPAAIRHMVVCARRPGGVYVASARDVSVGGATAASNAGETSYVGYEMWVRDLETRAGGIVGASGCLYAIRAQLHAFPVPEVLSRDFTAALVARREGYRAVSVRDALCIVPRGASLGREYERKVRTMTRGIATLIHNRDLLDPVRYGRFAWMLLSHKSVPLASPVGFAGNGRGVCTRCAHILAGAHRIGACGCIVWRVCGGAFVARRTAHAAVHRTRCIRCHERHCRTACVDPSILGPQCRAMGTHPAGPRRVTRYTPNPPNITGSVRIMMRMSSAGERRRMYSRSRRTLFFTSSIVRS